MRRLGRCRADVRAAQRRRGGGRYGNAPRRRTQPMPGPAPERCRPRVAGWSPMTIRATAHQPAPGCRPRVTGWSPRSRPPLGWEMPSPANQAKTRPDQGRLVAKRKRAVRAGARGRRCARRRFRFAQSARDSPGRQRRADFTASRARTNVVMVRSACAASRRRAKPCVGAIWYLVGRSRGGPGGLAGACTRDQRWGVFAWR